MIGFANPAIINARHTDVCNGFGSPGAVIPCTNIVKGQVNVQRFSRIPDVRRDSSESRDALSGTQRAGYQPWRPRWRGLHVYEVRRQRELRLPQGSQRELEDQPPATNGTTRSSMACRRRQTWGARVIAAPTETPVALAAQTLDLGHVGVQQRQSNVYTRTFITRRQQEWNLEI